MSVMAYVKTYESIEDALAATVRKEKEHILIQHKLTKGEAIGEHFHPAVDEWLILSSGRYDIRVDFENVAVPQEGVSVVHFPKGYVHGLTCLEGGSYFVVREGRDETFYLKDILKTRARVKPVNDTCGTLWELYNEGDLSVAYDVVTGTAGKHKHRILREKYRVEKGAGRLAIGNRIRDIKKGDVITIPRNIWHQLIKGKGKLEVLVITHPKYDSHDQILAGDKT